MASISIYAASTSRTVVLPSIPELCDPNFLDILLPPPNTNSSVAATTNKKLKKDVPEKKNSMMEALKSTTRRVFTENWAPAYRATDSPVLNAFSTLGTYATWSSIEDRLKASWADDPNLTLRLIWNIRSIHDGKGDKETFYRAFGWLYRHHPRTAISNLSLLVDPVCEPAKRKRKPYSGPMSHGYWKDLLNILALESVGELVGLSSRSTYLHAPRTPRSYRNRRNRTHRTGPNRLETHLLANSQAKEAAVTVRKNSHSENFDRLSRKLTDPKFRALFIAVARLFADQLLKDQATLQKLESLGPSSDQSVRDERFELLKSLTLVGKWAPSPGGSHDRVSNISTAIAELIYASQDPIPFPSILKTSITDSERAHVLRSFYQRWFLTELRRTLSCPEPLMSTNRWNEIKYSRVPSVCMKNNSDLFYKHDPERFEKYLIDVETGKKTISGATLLPHELVVQALEAEAIMQNVGGGGKFSALQEAKKKRAQAMARVVESQWKTLISNLREAGSIENAIAICDVSGSMGYFGMSRYSKRMDVDPIFPAVSLSLVLASLAKPPFNGGFITFSSHPEFVSLDLDKPLIELITEMSRTHWENNTVFSAVFLKLLLPLAIKNQVKPEDMIKRLFVFSDMQFDNARGDNSISSLIGNRLFSNGQESQWETNHDMIEKAYMKAGYDVPEIVYWNLRSGLRVTMEVDDSRRKGVVMVNGFSAAMLKVFMGEVQEEEDEGEGEDGEGKEGELGDWELETGQVKEKEEFNPVNVMKKALGKASFDRLVVVD